MLYIYIKKGLQTADGAEITLEQIAEIYQSDGSGAKQEKQLVLGTARKNQMTLITAIDVAKALQNDSAQIFGDACCVTVVQSQSKGSLVFKTILVALLMFAGGMMTIVNYHSDVDMPVGHEALSRIFTGSENFSPWINIVYALGVGFGVLFFSNMLPGKKKEPNIFEIEQYELDLQTNNLLRAQEEAKK